MTAWRLAPVRRLGEKRTSDPGATTKSVVSKKRHRSGTVDSPGAVAEEDSRNVPGAGECTEPAHHADRGPAIPGLDDHPRQRHRQGALRTHHLFLEAQAD